MLHDAGEVCGCTMESGLLRVRTCPGMALATELYFINPLVTNGYICTR